MQRAYIRHATSVPLDIVPQGNPQQMSLQLNDLSLMGLSFDSPRRLEVGSRVSVKIRKVRPSCRVEAIVQWCDQAQEGYKIGVQFLGEQDAFRIRMVEQVCHIEEYRKRERSKGRRLSKNRASEEWISANASRFPQIQR